MSYADEGPSGIGGWLAFYLVTLGVFSPLGMLFGVASFSAMPELQMMGGLGRSLLIVEWTLAALLIAACLFAAGRLILVRNWRSVQIAIGAMWSLAAVQLLIEPIAVSLAAGVPLDQALAGGFGIEAIRPIVYSAIWTAYLLRSQRVENTYRGEDGDAEALEQVFE